MSGLELYMVGLIVKDMVESTEFYRRLGMALPEDASAESHVEIEMTSGVTFFLDSRPHRWDPQYPRDTQQDVPDPYRSLLEVNLKTAAAVEQKYEEMTSFGYRGLRAPYSTPFGTCFAMISDPDGHTILLSGSLSTT